MPFWGTTKDENAVRHSGPDPESRYKRLVTVIRRYDDVFSYKFSYPNRAQRTMKITPTPPSPVAREG